MIEFANINDGNIIHNLWKTCFGDKDSYIDNFVTKRMTSDNCLVYKEEEKIFAMMFLLKSEIKIGLNVFKSYYIYAACTAPEHRGKGFMAQLIKKAEEIAADEGADYICLVPANEGLFDYYSRFGFTVGFEKKVLSLSRNQLNSIASDKADESYPIPKEIYDLRNKVFSNGDFYIWDIEAINYAIFENKSTGGDNVFVQSSGIFTGYAIYSEKEEKTFVKELGVLNGNLDLIFNLLLSKTKADIFIFNLPVNFPLTSDNFHVISNGMIKPISEKAGNNTSKIEKAYIGLTLE